MFFLIFLDNWLTFLIHAVIAQNFIPVVDLAIPIGTTTNVANAESENTNEKIIKVI